MGASPIIGQLLGHYRVVEQIGAGGMGMVFRAHDEQLERDVAIKLLPEGLLADEAARKRFRREALALAKLNHPNIATVYEFGSQEGVHFLVMELVSGISLESRLSAGPLSQKEVLRLGLQLADGLVTAHEQGVIHRDLKPANLRLTQDGRLKILDFGLAQFVRPDSGDLGITASLGEARQVTGTMPYMPPERLRAENSDARGDIWAVGAVLYEIATGRRAFPQRQIPTLIDAILNKSPEPPSSLNAKISPGLDAVIVKCLDRDPERRYQSARELRVDLDRLTAPISQVPGAAPSSSGAVVAARAPGLTSTASKLEIAHVLFLAVVEDAKLPLEAQQQQSEQLHSLLTASTEIRDAQSSGQLVRLASSDGIALVFFGDPEYPARCARQLAELLRAHAGLKVRMGIHSGPVYRVKDVDANLQVAGGGISVARRVMDFGDAGHILVSKSLADVLIQIGTWSNALHDLGEVAAASELRVHLFNLYTEQIGNPERPQQFRPVRARTSILIWSAAVVMVALVIAGGVAYLGRRYPRPPTVSPLASLPQRRSVAVLGFKNLTAHPEAAWLSTALPEMLTTELAAGEKIRTIPGEDVARAKIELALPDTDSLGGATLAQFGKNLGADMVVLGSYVALAGGKIRVDLRLQDVASGEVLASVPQTGDESNLFDLVSRAGALLREKCGAGQITTAEAASVKAALPSSPDAARFYAEGIAKLRVFEATAARDLLQKAVASDPKYAMAHSALAHAWSTLGYDEKARQSAKSAFDLSADLSREDRLLVEARYRETSKDWENASSIYRTLFGYFADNVEYGILLAKAQIRAGKGKDALATIESLRRLSPPGQNDARIDLAAAEASTSMGDFKQAQSLANSAVSKANAQGAKLLAARALYLKGLALENLGQPQEAITAAQQAQEIYAAVGDRNGIASTLEVMGNVLADRSDLPGSLAKYSEELVIVRELGNRRAESSALNNMALVLNQQGDLEGTRKTWEQALAISQEVGDKYNSAMTLLNLGGVLKDQGDLAAAEKTYEQALALSREINDQKGIASALAAQGTVLDAQGRLADAKKSLDQAIAAELADGQGSPSGDKSVDLGDVLQHQGDLAAARTAYQDGLALSRAADDKSMAAYALMGLGGLALKAGDFAEAERYYKEALAARTEAGEKANVAASQVAMAELALEKGQATGAETQVREAREQFRPAHKFDDAIAATAMLARLLLAEGKTAEAKRELESVAALAKKNQNAAVRLEFVLAQAKVNAATGQRAQAQQLLDQALAQAIKSGFGGYILAIRLAKEEIEAGGGPRSASSRARLEQVESDARAKGFNLIAQRAAKLRS